MTVKYEWYLPADPVSAGDLQDLQYEGWEVFSIHFDGAGYDSALESRVVFWYVALRRPVETSRGEVDA